MACIIGSGQSFRVIELGADACVDMDVGAGVGVASGIGHSCCVASRG